MNIDPGGKKCIQTRGFTNQQQIPPSPNWVCDRITIFPKNERQIPSFTACHQSAPHPTGQVAAVSPRKNFQKLPRKKKSEKKQKNYEWIQQFFTDHQSAPQPTGRVAAVWRHDHRLSQLINWCGGIYIQMYTFTSQLSHEQRWFGNSSRMNPWNMTRIYLWQFYH